MNDIDIHLLREKIAREVEQWKEKTANHYTIEAETRWSEANYILGILDSLRQEQHERHYTKVREIKTGKEFLAEYSTESAEWYEAGTGNAYSISDVEIVKEKQEVSLEKEIDACWQNWLSPSNQKEVEGVLPKTEFAMYASHFYELGKNSK